MPKRKHITFSDGYLGSRNDEERSEMRYVLRLAETSESSNLRTHLALPVSAGSMPVGVSAENTSPQRAAYHISLWTQPTWPAEDP